MTSEAEPEPRIIFQHGRFAVYFPDPMRKTEMSIEERLKERADEWETISFHNVHTRKVTWEDCVQISHGFGAICPDCRHAPKCFAKRCRYR